jgi:hypothetical protein
VPTFTLRSVDVEIRPQPDDEEREAIVAALARARVDVPRPHGYESPWRTAGLREAADVDEP